MCKLEQTTIVWHGQSIIMTGSATCEQLSQGIDPCHRLRTAEFSTQWALGISLQGAQGKLQTALSRGKGYAVSDGSFKDKAGSAAWIIEGANVTN